MAIIAAVVLSVLLVLSAFTLDFGLSYTNKRDLQTSADAAALAAASTYADESGTCSVLAASAALRGDARDAANALMADNHSEATVVGDIVVACAPDGSGRLQVTWTNENATDANFGGLVGIGEINASRSATAELGVPAAAYGLRPYALCTEDLPASFPSGVVEIRYDGPTSIPCPGSDRNGNWWTLNCPDGAGGTNVLANNTEFGCADPVSTVAGQEPYLNDPATLSSHLIAACPGPGSSDEDCLGADPGNIRSARVRAAWNTLLGEDIVIPVFCGETASAPGMPYCDPPAVTDPNGSRTQYPIHKFTVVEVCGWHWGNQSNDVVRAGIATTDCAGADTAPGPGPQNYLQLAFKQALISGTITPADCALGDLDCDGGTRFVLLVN